MSIRQIYRQETQGEGFTDLEIAQQQSAARAEHILKLMDRIAEIESDKRVQKIVMGLMTSDIAILEADKRELERRLTEAIKECAECRGEYTT